MNRYAPWLGALAFVAIIVVAANAKPAPAPAPSTTTVAATTTTTPATTTTTTTTLPAARAVTCADIASAPSGARLELGGADMTCDLTATATNVTVTGPGSGTLWCRKCDGWSFTGLDWHGQVRLIGGIGWRVVDSHLDGDDLGWYGVLAVGATDQTRNPKGWVIDHVTVTGVGNSPDHPDNQDHALYVIGLNGERLDGTITNSTFHGGGAGATVKIGGTGNDGAAGDAADGVTLADSTITSPDSAPCVLISTDSDFARLEHNDLTGCKGPNIDMAGPYGGYFAVINGTSAGPGRWLFVHYWNNNGAGVLGRQLYGTNFATVARPEQGCAGFATCTDNVSPPR